ncbi:hypothetical protein [Lichenicoccus roseus]|uniref:Uncharacterized protein n=1 Tax=Lichenicoccus roseus TaxID=2683649 RepID=A0A5R9JBB9_9PROT|nr:hypothetical protein [Lichenicoccus roseus]TLU72686.1 hypothetical protein FE263_11680 [Lichenicoccus roseus]
MNFFSGWIGYGVSVAGGALLEPVDPVYARRPILFSPLQNGTSFDIGSGTCGPSSTSWGTLAFAGVFDAAVAGNLLLWWPLLLPTSVPASSTYTTGPRANTLVFRSLREGPDVVTYPGGSIPAVMPNGTQVTAGVALQVAGGVLAAVPFVFGASVVMSQLPAASATGGSGQLWNDGGVVAVS